MNRILFLVSSMEGGGAERIAAVLSNYWVSQGDEVVLMSTYSGRGGCAYALDDRVRMEFLADLVGATGRGLGTRIQRFIALRRRIRDEDFDVVLSFLPHVNVATLLCTLGLNKPVIVSERIYPPALAVSPAVALARRLLYPLAGRVVVQTQAGKEWIERNCRGSTVDVIANPVEYPLSCSEPAVRPESVLRSNQAVVLACGRLEPQKNFDGLIRAFAAIADDQPGCDLVIVGEGSERGRLEELAASLDLAERVCFPGRVGNMRAWYESAAVFVLSSHFEGFPNTLVEAMAHGVPVVSVDCPTGPSDIIESEVDGVLVPPEEGNQGLARALADLLGDPSRRARLARAALAVRARFSLESVGQQWADLFLQLRRESG